MASHIDQQSYARMLEASATAHLRELAAETVDSYHDITDPVSYLFAEWHIDGDNIETGYAHYIASFRESEIGQFMLERCANPRVSTMHEANTFTLRVRITGTIDRTSSVEWRLRCAG